MNYPLCLLSLFIVGCRSAVNECKPKVTLFYTNAMGGQGSPRCYEHFLVLDVFEEACFARINFAAMARSYVKAPHRQGPVRFVTFLQPGSQTFFDVSEPDMAGLGTYQIIRFQMDSLAIKAVFIGAHGREKKFQVLNNGLAEQ